MKRIIRTTYNYVTQYRWFNRIQSFARRAIQGRKLENLYFAKNGNFGDELNDDLMQYYDIAYKHSHPLAASLCCIGSNLQVFVNNNSSKKLLSQHTVSVLGSGFISEAEGVENFIFNMNIYALRGELSLKRCEEASGNKLSSVVLGDPGLLIHRIFPGVSRKPIYDVGVICHMVDKNSEYMNKIQLNDMRVKYIDIEQGTKKFVEEVAECGFILSSAMHGLICADSLGIPNKHIVLSNKVTGGEYKFRDYYSVFNDFEYKPVYLYKNIIHKEDIEIYRGDYTITSADVDTICDNLERAFKMFKNRNINV